MGWTKAVSSVIKQKVAGHLVNKISSVFAKGAQTKKLAAKLASKSSLDVEKSPTSHLSAANDPFKYAMLYYPEETQNLGEGHYIIFDIIMNNQTFENAAKNPGGKMNKLLQVTNYERLDARVEPGLKRMNQLKKQGYGLFTNKYGATTLLRKPMTGAGSEGPGQLTHTFFSDSIILYTPPTVKFEYKSTYEQAETKNLALLKDSGEALFDNIQQFMDGNFSGMGDLLGTLKDAGKVLGRQVLQGALEVTFPGAAGFFTKQSGRAINPRMELAFQSVPFRNFQFEFEFAPKNQKEVEQVNKIINLMKFHMLPDVSDEKYLITPSEFQIGYYYREKANMYVPKISRCVLTDMSVDYSPEGVFSTFKADEKGAMPVISKMTLSFTETEIMTKQTTADGY